MSELKFYNINVIYDDTKINKRTIFINNCITYLGIILTLIILCVVMFIVPVDVLDTTLGSLIAVIGGAIFIMVGVSVEYFILQKIYPRHYEFVIWMMKFKYNDLEFGLFNDRYIVETFLPKGWNNLSLNYFIGEEFVLHEDNIDKSKLLYLTIDCTKEKIEVIISNE